MSSQLRIERELFPGHFNERLVLSLASNPCCILMDDELNILPISSHVKSIAPVEADDNGNLIDDPSREDRVKLEQLTEQHRETQVPSWS